MQKNVLLYFCMTLIVVVGIMGVFKNTNYSGADEAAHFDYVNFIVDSHHLPTLEQMTDVEKLSIAQANVDTIPLSLRHEAVQPPLYYVLGALISGSFDDIYIRLIVLRFAGVLGIVISFYLAYRTYLVLVERKYIQPNHYLYFSISMLFILSPEFQKIMIPLNNDHLLIILVSVLLYVFVLWLENEKITLKQTIFIGILMGCILLTKLTAGYLVVIGVGYFIYKKWYKPIGISAIIVALMTLPWALLNFKHYHALTGTKRHVEIVLPMVNPTNYNFTLFDVIKSLPDFFSYMWVRNDETIITLLNSFVSMLVILSIIFGIIKIKERVTTLFVLSIIGNIIILCFVTITQDVYAMIGRYAYMNYVSFVILMYYFITNTIDAKYMWLITVMCAVIGFIIVGNFVIKL
jgi:hypothetical protein